MFCVCILEVFSIIYIDERFIDLELGWLMCVNETYVFLVRYFRRDRKILNFIFRDKKLFFRIVEDFLCNILLVYFLFLLEFNFVEIISKI